MRLGRGKITTIRGKITTIRSPLLIKDSLFRNGSDQRWRGVLGRSGRGPSSSTCGRTQGKQPWDRGQARADRAVSAADAAAPVPQPASEQQHARAAEGCLRKPGARRSNLLFLWLTRPRGQKHPSRAAACSSSRGSSRSSTQGGLSARIRRQSSRSQADRRKKIYYKILFLPYLAHILE